MLSERTVKPKKRQVRGDLYWSSRSTGLQFTVTNRVKRYDNMTNSHLFHHLGPEGTQIMGRILYIWSKN